MALNRRIPEQIKHPAPLYALVGAGDFVVARIRGADAEGERQSLQAQVRAFPTRVQAGVHSAVDQASETYGDLAKRGEDLVARIRRQQSTQDLEKQVKATVSQAKGTATSARKAAQTTSTRAKATATSAEHTADVAGRAATDAGDKVGD